jgi:holliday junction DNA helicase RuvB
MSSKPSELSKPSKPEDAAGESDLALRPHSLADFIGQEKLVGHLAVYLGAARARAEALDHVLFYGPPGLGKTTLSRIMAEEMGVNIVMTTAPAIERAGDLASILTALQERDVLFIDEIHRLRANIEETLYSAMEDYSIDIVIGQGVGARTVRIPLPRFTLIGASTRTGLLSAPFMARFGIVNRLEYYTPAEIARIIRRNAALLGVAINEEGVRLFSERVRGTPRVCNTLLRRMRDFLQVENYPCLDAAFVEKTLTNLGIDSLGLDVMNRRYLEALIRDFDGGPVGVETLAVSLSEDKETLSDVYEPFLIQLGMIKRTLRGRVAQRRAWQHLGIPENENSGSAEQGELL